MKTTLIDDFKKFMKIRNENKRENIENLTPTTVLPLLIHDKTIKLDSVEKLEHEKDNSIEITNSILNKLNIPKSNIGVMKFLFYELISNIQDHSEFDESYIMGKSYDNSIYDFTFIDNGISIPKSFENNEYDFHNDKDAIIKALNGLSTKKELGFIERGTGLNNTANIVTNGCSGSVLIVSRCGLVYITNSKLTTYDLAANCINGTMVSLRVNLAEKINIYNYLNHENYKKQ